MRDHTPFRAAPTLRPLPPRLPAWLAPLHRRAADLVERLPTAPPSAAMALALNRWLLPRLPEDARQALQGQVVTLAVKDWGLRLVMQLGSRGFVAAAGAAKPVLQIQATSEAYWQLAKGDQDPDRLFFERRLVMEGDTELGLVLKNTLDAIGPGWLPWR